VRQSTKMINCPEMEPALFRNFIRDELIAEEVVFDFKGCENSDYNDTLVIDALENMHEHCKSLKMMNCNILTDTTFRIIANMKRLWLIEFNNCETLSNSCASTILKNLTNLQSVTFKKCASLTPVGIMDTVVNIRDLIHFEFSCSSSFNERTVMYLHKLVNLVSLGIPNTAINGQTMPETALPRLTNLNISYCRSIDEFGFKHMAKIDTLKFLNMSYCRTFAPTMTLQIAKLIHLEALDVSFCVNLVTDKSFCSLSTLTNLRQLRMKGCTNIGDSVASITISLFKLITYLDISSCTRITNNAIDTIEKELPALSSKNYIRDYND